MRLERGNALLYVLLGVALFAALSYTFSRSNQGGTAKLDDETATLMAHQLISHAGQVSQAIQQMLMTGSRIEDIDFTKPGEAGYGTNAQHQVYHPAGGGINVFDESDPDWIENSAGIYDGWHSMTATNVTWTPTTAVDVIYTFVSLNRDICQKVNDILADDETIPAVTVVFNSVFNEGSTASDDDFTSGGCSDCVGKMNMCVSNVALNRYAFYNVVASQ